MPGLFTARLRAGNRGLWFNRKRSGQAGVPGKELNQGNTVPRMRSQPDLWARRRALAIAAWSVWICFAACGPRSEGPSEADFLYSRNGVEMYGGLDPRAPVSGILEFDTRARVLETHRSFVRIRTDDRQEGWVPRSMLLDHGLRGRLRALSTASADLPPQGLSRPRDTLNVHVEPYRWSPTFYQLKKDEGFHVLDRMLVDRLPSAAQTAPTIPEPTGEDYWYLVRIPQIGEAGWLLGNMVYADLPLEVAMLAQGKTVVGYFPIGSITDESLGETKTTWLWVQSTARGQVHDFDRVMVFRWDSRRDRYLIIRQNSNLKGYLPVELLPGLETKRGTGMGYRILLERNGELRQRTYVYTRDRVYPLGEDAVTGMPDHVPPGGFGARYEFVQPPRVEPSDPLATPD